MNTRAITAKIAAITRNPARVVQVVAGFGRLVLYVLFHELVTGSAGIAFCTEPPTKGTNMNTIRNIRAPIAVDARIAIGVEIGDDVILPRAIVRFTLLT